MYNYSLLKQIFLQICKNHINIGIKPIKKPIKREISEAFLAKDKIKKSGNREKILAIIITITSPELILLFISPPLYQYCHGDTFYYLYLF